MMTVEKADSIIAAVLQADPDFDEEEIDNDVEDLNFYEDNIDEDLDVFKFIDEESNKDEDITNIVKDFMCNEDFTANIISIQAKPIKTELFNQTCVKLKSIPSEAATINGTGTIKTSTNNGTALIKTSTTNGAATIKTSTTNKAANIKTYTNNGAATAKTSTTNKAATIKTSTTNGAATIKTSTTTGAATIKTSTTTGAATIKTSKPTGAATIKTFTATGAPVDAIIKAHQQKSKPVMITCKPGKTKAAPEAFNPVPTKIKKVILADKNSGGGIAFQNEYQKYIRTLDPGISKKKTDNKENEQVNADIKEEIFKKPHAVTLGQYKQLLRPKIQLLAQQPQQHIKQIVAPQPAQKNITILSPLNSNEKIYLQDFHSIPESDPSFIGDYTRMFDTFEKIGENCAQQKSQRNIESLDTWGGSEDVPSGAFDFDLDYELLQLGIPADWKDVEVFSGLDKMRASEKEFQYNWLPKTAPPAPRNEHYRQILRTLNTADPNFNIKMKLV